MLSAVMPVSEASLSPLPPPLSPPPPPQAARVEATVAAARTVTRRREDLVNGSPVSVAGLRCPDGGWAESSTRPASSPPTGTSGAPGPQTEQAQADRPDDPRGGEDHREDQDGAVDEGRELGGLGPVEAGGGAEVGHPRRQEDQDRRADQRPDQAAETADHD